MPDFTEYLISFAFFIILNAFGYYFTFYMSARNNFIRLCGLFFGIFIYIVSILVLHSAIPLRFE